MPATPYATEAELTSWLGDDQPLPDHWEVDRVLLRASSTVDRMVTAAYATDDDDLPTAAAVAAALRDATCAVVEYWLAAGGEDVDRVQLIGPVEFDGVSMGSSASWYSPRAAELLRQAKLRGEPGAA